LDYIQNKGKINEEELNFKFSAEMFNNLDIIQNKFGEPVKYGDIIMLMHENTKMFIKFVPSTKTLTLSNHDSEATLFSVETANEIMLNDNQILKSGQPLKLRIAWFQYANQNLYYGLRFNYENENKLKQDDDFENNQNYDIEKKKVPKRPRNRHRRKLQNEMEVFNVRRLLLKRKINHVRRLRSNLPLQHQLHHHCRPKRRNRKREKQLQLPQIAHHKKCEKILHFKRRRK
jgi:hypothetical protein